jgi:hypothetical protein
MNARKTFLGITSLAIIAAGIMAANCGGDDNSNPAPGSGGSTGASGGALTGGSGGAGTNSSGGGAAGMSGGGAAGAPSDGGDGGPTCGPVCNPAAYADAGCTPCAPNPLFACPLMGVTTTCIHFDNATIPANIPPL